MTEVKGCEPGCECACWSGPTLHETMEGIKSRKVRESTTRRDEAKLSTRDALGARQDLASSGFLGC